MEVYFTVNPAFRTYALCAAILALKMLFSAFYTGVQRSRHQAFANAEDAKTFGRPGATASTDEVPEVAHALRIQRNDGENIPIFFAIGSVLPIVANMCPRRSCAQAGAQPTDHVSLKCRLR